MERTEWPDAEKLAELRSSGQVAVSSFSLVCLGSAAWLLALYVQRHELPVLQGLWLKLYARPDLLTQAAAEETLAQVFSILVRLFAAPAAVVAIAVLGGGLFQSACLIRPAALGLDLNKISPFAQPAWSGALRRLGLALLVMLLAVGASAGLVYLSAAGILGLLNLKREVVALWLPRQYSAIMPFALISLGLAAFFGWLIRRFTFMLEHRITKAEAERQAGLH